jgi:FkbH-like protein
VGEGELARVAQLTQKTNQFNMTTRRYSEAETALLLNDDATVVRAYSLVDRFGDSGIVSVVIARKGAEAWELDSFLMSCRVIGRTVETAILALIADEARAASAGALVGDFLPTKKNAPASGVYEAHGFVENGGADSEGGRRWSLDLGGDSAPRVPAWIEIAD